MSTARARSRHKKYRAIFFTLEELACEISADCGKLPKQRQKEHTMYTLLWLSHSITNRRVLKHEINLFCWSSCSRYNSLISTVYRRKPVWQYYHPPMHATFRYLCNYCTPTKHVHSRSNTPWTIYIHTLTWLTGISRRPVVISNAITGLPLGWWHRFVRTWLTGRILNVTLELAPWTLWWKDTGIRDWKIRSIGQSRKDTVHWYTYKGWYCAVPPAHITILPVTWPHFHTLLPYS